MQVLCALLLRVRAAAAHSVLHGRQSSLNAHRGAALHTRRLKAPQILRRNM